MLVNPLFYNQEFLPAFYNNQFVEYAKPKLVKKLENEELVQFKIFKGDGNFNDFEFKLIKLNDYQGLLEVFSTYDDFKVSIKLNLDKVDIQNINFEVEDYNRTILNLNIPKRVETPQPNDLFADYLSSFINQLQGYDDKHRVKDQRKEQEKALKEKQKALREQEKARKEHEKAIREQEKARREQERAREQERRERIRREQERQERIRKEQERIRKEQERQQRIQREKEARLRKVHEEKIKQQREQQQKQTQEFVTQLLSGFLPQAQASFNQQPTEFPFNAFQFPFGQPRPQQAAGEKNEPEYKKARSEKVRDPIPDPEVSVPVAEVITKSPVLEPIVETPDSPSTPSVDMDDVASINSDISVETPNSLESLHKHPSLEEVEDEEFVMLRKKFGQ